VGPHILLRRRTQKHWRNLHEGFVVFWKLEAGIFEGLPEVIQLRKIDVAGAARSAILT
jgi:hypothetical protein